MEERNWFTTEESRTLYDMAVSLGHGAFWKISVNNKISCMICGEYICRYQYEGEYQKHLVNHMNKHLKLKAFI